MKNFLISFPRSGQHLMERLLKDVYQYYGLGFSYCEFYSCCRKAPCSKGSLFTKNHDFGINLPIVDRYRYLVLYRRDKLRQLEAWFRMERQPLRASLGPTHRNCPSLNYTQPQTFQQFVNFARINRAYFDNFRGKWIEKNNRGNCLLVEYYDLVKQPHIFLLKILKFFNPDHSFKEEDVQKILEERTERVFVKNKNYLKDEVAALLRHSLQQKGIQL